MIILLVVFPSCKFLREKGLIGRKADTMAVWQTKQDSIRVIDSVRKVQDRLLAIENARLDSVRKSDQEKSEWESKYRYNIIVGSYITPEYARTLSSDLSKKGYKTRILKLEGTNFEMVSAEAHENFRTAVARLKQFQDTVAFDSWMYIIKK
jgi:Fe-S oxidoreductase